MTNTVQKAILAGGCFWGMQELLRKLDGVMASSDGTQMHLIATEGRYDAAAAAYARAFDAWRALDSPLDLAMCGLDRASVRGAGAAAGNEDDEAREIFTRLGAVPLLARLDRAAEAASKAG